MAHYIQNKNILVRTTDNENILFNPENGELHKVNAHALFVWQCVKRLSSLNNIIDKVKRKYSFNSEEDLKKSILKILKYFIKKNVIIEK